MSTRLNLAQGGNARMEFKENCKTAGKSKPKGEGEAGAAKGNAKTSAMTVDIDIDIDIGGGVQQKKERESGQGQGKSGGGEGEAGGLLGLLKDLFGGAKESPQGEGAGDKQENPIMKMIQDILSKVSGGGDDGAGETAPMQGTEQQPAATPQQPTAQATPQQPAAPQLTPEEKRKQEQVVKLTTVIVDKDGKETGRKDTLVGGETRGASPTGKPKGDNRTADDIMEANPDLKELADKKGPKFEELKKKFGDWTSANSDPKSRADAAYNVACTLNGEKAEAKRKQEQVVKLTTIYHDQDGKETGRKDTLVGGEQRGGQPNGRPAGDNRTADDIAEANPILKELADQKGPVFDKAKAACGDWTSANPDPKSRADAAYNAACMINNQTAAAKRDQEKVVKLTTVTVDKDGKETGRKDTLVGGETRGAPPTGKPEGDNRTADDIMEANPILKEMADQKGDLFEKAKAQFGDWTSANPDPKSRADAAYNVACVMNQGKANKEAADAELAKNPNKVIDGVGGEQRGGKPTGPTGRPEGDTRSADDIINANPALKNLGNQKDIEQDNLKKQCGDWTSANPDPKSRADAAYNAAKVLNWIDSSKNRDGEDRDSVNGGVGDGNIEGITNDGDARHGTEAGNLKDFAEQGYGALKDDHRLDQTDDTHVRKDGSNMDNFQWGCKEASKYIGFIPIIGGFLKGVGESKDGIGNGLLAGFKGAAEDTLDMIKKGKITPWGFAEAAVEGGVKQGVAAITHTDQYADS
jgi:hypothetical protein